jgi:hypothetical protein
VDILNEQPELEKVQPTPLNRDNVALIFLASVPAGFFGATQVQKGLFLIARNLPEIFKTPYDFQPDSYGPADPAVFADMKKLEVCEYVRIIRERNLTEYVATTEGLACAQELAQALTDKQTDYMRRVAKWVLSLSWTDLVTSILRAYPDMATNMIFRSKSNDVG